MRSNPIINTAVIFTFMFLSVTMSWAQQVPSDPTSSHIFPAGGRRGTQVSVRVGGECLPPLTRFRLFGEGVSAPDVLGPKALSRGEPSPRRRPGEVPIYYPKEWRNNIDIADDAPIGMKLWRLSCARGGTGARPFIVGELPEWIESESNSTPAQSERVTLPITINGQIEGERDLDYFQFEANEGEVVSADIVSCRLGSPLEPFAEFYDEQDTRVEAKIYRAGCDPVLSMCVPRTGKYRLMLGHLGFQGGPQFVYRVTLSTQAYVPFVFPAGGQVGSTRKFEGFALTGIDQLRSLPFEFAIPKTHLSRGWIHGKLSSQNSIELHKSDLPDVLEQEGNDSPSEAQDLKDACVVDGRFLTATDEDWYRFSTTKGALWAFECQRFPAGSDCLPIVTITNRDGAPLASANMADDPKQPCRIQWRSPEDGEYCLRLRDVQQGIRGGPDFIYRLSVRPARPSFELSLAADFANIVQGTKTEIDLKARRFGDFTSPIEVQIEGLPDGVRFAPTQIAVGQESIKLSFMADDNARPCDVPLTIRGTATVDGTQISSVAFAQHLGRDSDGVSVGDSMVNHIQLTVRHKPMVRLFCNEAYQYAYRGTVYPYSMEIERLNGFTGAVHIEIADRQIKDLDGIVVHDTVVEPTQTQFMLPIYLPETMHINVQAHSNIYAQAHVQYEDNWGQTQSQSVVSEMRCMIRPLPTVVKLHAVESETMFHAGETVTFPLKLDRTSIFTGAMKVELVDPDKETGCVAQSVIIETGKTEATMKVQFPSSLNRPISSLKFRATGEMPGYASVISESSTRLKIAPAQQSDSQK